MKLSHLIGIFSLAVLAGLARAPAADTWPSLPTKGFMSGRAATQDDVKKGDAAFAAEAAGMGVGRPAPIVIPQYAYWTNEHGRQVPVIVLQAEDTPLYRIFGVRDFSGADIICTGPEIELLGTTPPK